MLLMKILGAIDLISGLTFLMIIFGIKPFLPIILFCAGLLLVKSLFIFTGEPLSIIDLLCAIVLVIAGLIGYRGPFLWLPAFLLVAKGMYSFV